MSSCTNLCGYEFIVPSNCPEVVLEINPFKFSWLCFPKRLLVWMIYIFYGLFHNAACCSEFVVLTGTMLSESWIRKYVVGSGNIQNMKQTDCLGQWFFQPVCREGSADVPRELGERSKEARKKLRNKKITVHHRAVHFIQNLIFSLFHWEKREGVLQGERGREHSLRPMAYIIGSFL
jgi:hypothetical protein